MLSLEAPGKHLFILNLKKSRATSKDNLVTNSPKTCLIRQETCFLD